MAEINRIQMIVFDWAGTTTDYGGVAPSVVFGRVFREEGISLTKEEINAPMGMEKKDLQHIFERLYKCDQGRSQKGSGLGLAITHQLVEKMGGTITAASTPGKGTTFAVRFPLAE